MTHPVDSVFVDGVNVSKAAVRSFHKLRSHLSMASVSELRASDMTGQFGLVYVRDIARFFALDSSDSTSSDNGSFILVDAAGNRFKWAVQARETLTANRTYYVRPDGSDNNNGLTNAAGGAFLTIQKAIDKVAALDLGIYNVTIQVADGTYSGTIVCNGPWLGSGLVVLQGNTVTPANVLISTTAQIVTVKNGSSLIIKGFKLTASAGHLMECVSGGYLEYSYMDFGSASTASHVRCSDGGKIKATGPYTISGGAGQHWSSVGSGCEIRCQFQTITITGTPAFAWQFANGQLSGGLIVNGNTFSGSATGARYNAADLGRIYTAGAGTSYLPGNAAGSGTNPSASPYGLYN